jgi:hypothetical protein
MSCVILCPFACHSEAESKNLKDCSGRDPAKNVWTSEILHGACPETLRGVYPEQDQILRFAQDDRGRRAQSDSRRIQDDRRYPEIHNRVAYSANL